MTRARWWRIGAIAAVVATLVAPALPGATAKVLAHAQLVASSPAGGAVVPESPDEIRLVFSEPLEEQGTSLDVVAEDGTALLERAGEIDPNDPYALVVAGPDLPNGVYSLTWRTLSAADGHTAEGFFTFGIGEAGETLPPVAGGGMTHRETDVLVVAGRWATYLGLMLAFGVPIFHRVVIRDASMPRPLVRTLAAGLLLSGVATLVVAVASAMEAGAVADYLIGSRNGGLQLTRAVVAGVGAAALLIAAPAMARAVSVLAGAVGIVLLVAAGHAAALPGAAPIAGQAAHVLAAAIWMGGLAALVALVLRPGLVASGGRPDLRRLVPRFSALALVSIGILALTGVYAAWTQMGVVITTDTEYGRALLVKSAIAVVALSLGGLGYLDGGRLRRGLASFRGRVTAEAVAAAVVLAVTAVLATTPPVEEVGGVAIEPVPDAFGTLTPGMEMQLLPGRPGVNRIVVTTTDAMAAGSGRLELALDRVDTGATTRVPLTLDDHAGMEGMAGMEHGEMAAADDGGTVDWVADAVVLPAGSRWDTSVRVLASNAAELTRQRFAFSMSSEGVEERRVSTLLTPGTVVAVLFLVGGALGIGLGLGGMSLPRCDAWSSRIALVGGGASAVVLGALIGLSRLVG